MVDKTGFGSCLRAVIFLSVVLIADRSTRAQVEFLGVAAGDPSTSEVVLWTRALDTTAPIATTLSLAVAANDPTVSSNPMMLTAVTDPSRDHTAKVAVTGLLPGTRYYYRFSVGGAQSEIGTFKTAPDESTTAAVRFGFSGDADGAYRPYPLVQTLGTLGLDFFIFNGDAMYGNGSSGSPATAATGTLPTPTSNGATQAQLLNDYHRKYREQLIPVNFGGQAGLRTLGAAAARYSLYDNHELGNLQYINGGAPAGGPVGGMPSGAGVDPRVATNDVNIGATFINKSLGFQTLQRAFMNWQPVKERGLLSTPSDPRTDGTPRLYLREDWGRNAAIFIVDDRSYRDIRMRTASNGDATSFPRADHPGRTMLGATQLAWLEQSLLDAETSGVVWKIIVCSSTIDQAGPLGSSIPGVPNSNDSGKSWIGAYRAERNRILKFIADQSIKNVVFLATDDHQTRINEVLYSTTGATNDQSSYIPLPHAFSIVTGPIGASGPPSYTSHVFSAIANEAAVIAAAQASVGVDPLGLSPSYPGLHDLHRESHPTADVDRLPIDFYCPDLFTTAILDIAVDGTLEVEVLGITPANANAFLEYDPISNPLRPILSFKIAPVIPTVPNGQSNSACATLRVNGIGDGMIGPITTLSPAGNPIAFDWTGPSHQPLALLYSPILNVGQDLASGLIVDLDLDEVVVLFNGFEPAWSATFVTDGSGLAEQSFYVHPAASGYLVNIQGVVFDLGNACNGTSFFMTTAAFSIQF